MLRRSDRAYHWVHCLFHRVRLARIRNNAIQCPCLQRLRRRDQTEIMLGVLQVAFGGYGIVADVSVTGQFEVFFRDMSRIAANSDVRAVEVAESSSIHSGYVERLALSHVFDHFGEGSLLGKYFKCVEGWDARRIGVRGGLLALLKGRTFVGDAQHWRALYLSRGARGCAEHSYRPQQA